MKQWRLYSEVDSSAGWNTSVLAFTSVPLLWSGPAWCPSKRGFLTRQCSSRALSLSQKRPSLAAPLAAVLPDLLAVRSHDIVEGWGVNGWEVHTAAHPSVVFITDKSYVLELSFREFKWEAAESEQSLIDDFLKQGLEKHWPITLLILGCVFLLP